MRIKQPFRLTWLAAALLGIISFAASVQAQDLTGEIDGTVRDSSGASIPNAEVVVKNADQNLVARTLRTNDQGQFTASLLSLAHYSVTVNATGFRSATKTLDVHTGVNSNAAFVLEPGSVVQTVNVNVATDTVVEAQLDNAAAGTLISSTKISELSLSSRNFLQMLPIQPGVASGVPGPQDRGSISTAGGVNSASYEVNGIPAQYNGYFLDGQDLQRRSAGGTQIGAYPGIDLIREINLERSNFGAQYGGSGSASISIASKSGNIDLHGALYEFYRSQIFNANNYFNNLAGAPLPSLRYSDFGYELAGPVWIPRFTDRKSAKTFFVVGQEFLRSKMSVQSTLTNVPTAQQRVGIFNATICTAYNAAGACVASATSIPAIDPEAKAYLTDVVDKIPLPNSPTDPQGLIVSEGGTNNETQTFVRIDQHINDKFSVFFRFFNDPFNLTVPYGLRQGVQAPGVGTANVTNGDRAYYGSGTYVFSPTNVLQAGGGYLRSYVTAQAIGTLLASNSPDIHPTLPYLNTTGRVPNLAIGGSTYATISPYTNGEPQTQVFANDTQLFGRHTVSAGFNLEWQKAGNNVATTNAGAYTFKATTVPKAPASMTAATQFDQAFANFLAGSVTSFQQVSPDPSVYLHANLYEAYLQDDFHARPNLIVNMGVRYSYIASPSSGTLKGRPYLPFVNFAPARYSASSAPTIDTAGLICTKTPCNGGVLPNPAYNPSNGIIIANLNSPYGSKVTDQAILTFAPRFGFSYDVSGNGRTVIRGGYGIYYIQSTTADYGSLGNSNQPNIQNLLISNTNFSNPGGGAVAGNPSPQVVKAAQTNWQSPYVQAYSLDLQHTFRSILTDVGYYGNRVLHLPVNEDINQPLPGLFAQKNIIPGGVVNATNTPDLNRIRPYLGYGPINSDIQFGISNYNSLQTSLTKRFRDGSLATVNYTYSRTLTNATAPQNIYNPGAEYGPDSSGRTNILNFNFVYVLPFFLKQESFKGYLLGGWEFTGIVSFASGQFLTANTSAVDPAGQGILATGTAEGNDRPDYVSNPNMHAPHTQLQWFNTTAFTAVPASQYRPGNSSNGSIIGPGYENWDLSLFKNVHFEAGRDLQFRFETFNAFNHTNFSAVSTTTSATNYGQVTSAGSARVLQLGAKFTF